jgi:hypothetical protein
MRSKVITLGWSSPEHWQQTEQDATTIVAIMAMRRVRFTALHHRYGTKIGRASISSRVIGVIVGGKNTTLRTYSRDWMHNKENRAWAIGNVCNR